MPQGSKAKYSSRQKRKAEHIEKGYEARGVSRREAAEMGPMDRARKLQGGRVGWILLWLIGIPIPVLIVLYLLRGCT
jgi:hypothetical protein